MNSVQLSNYKLCITGFLIFGLKGSKEKSTHDQSSLMFISAKHTMNKDISDQ